MWFSLAGRNANTLEISYPGDPGTFGEVRVAGPAEFR